jgi:ribonuclease E
MLINVSEGEECRIALVEDNRLEELYIERTSSTSHVGNIYKGRVTNVEASIQAAFIDFGLGRNGFLHVSDLLPDYFGKKGEDVEEYVGKKMARRDRPPIQRCLRRGDEITVQVIKEGIGTKGPTLSSYLSVSGKMLVMMPGVSGRGVSRKIEDEQERRRLKQILDSLDPPEDCGFIIRTEATGKSKAEIERDLKYLARLWEQMKKKRDSSKGPTELYTEGDLVTRTIRDLFNTDIDRVVVDNAEVADRVREVVRLTTPRAKDKVETYTKPIPMFHDYGIERDVELMYSRHVPLPGGGSLVIDSTEAVVAIDVNSGKFRVHNDAEMTAFKTDMEAADEICRQLKLRDLGGVIICDFIDLRYERNRRELEHRLVENFKKDRAKTKVLRMSQFGIVEITRQRMRPSLKRSVYFDCPHCKGAGLVKTPESMSLDVMRRLAIAMNDAKVIRAELGVCSDVANYLNNRKRRQLADLEDRTKKQVTVRVEPSLGLDEMRLDLYDNRDGMVLLPELSDVMTSHPHTSQINVRGRGPGGKPGSLDDRRRGHDRKPPHEIKPQDRAREMVEDRLDLGDEEYDERPEGDVDRQPADERGDDEGAEREQDRGGRNQQPGGREPRGPQRQDRQGGGRVGQGPRDNRQGGPPRGDQRDRPQGQSGQRRDGNRDAAPAGPRDDRGRGQRDDRPAGPRDNRGQAPRDDRGPRRDERGHGQRDDRDNRPNRGGGRGQPPARPNADVADEHGAPAGGDQAEDLRERQDGPGGAPAGPQGTGGDEQGNGGQRRRRRRRRRGRGRGRDNAQQPAEALGGYPAPSGDNTGAPHNNADDAVDDMDMLPEHEPRDREHGEADEHGEVFDRGQRDDRDQPSDDELGPAPEAADEEPSSPGSETSAGATEAAAATESGPTVEGGNETAAAEESAGEAPSKSRRGGRKPAAKAKPKPEPKGRKPAPKAAAKKPVAKGRPRGGKKGAEEPAQESRTAAKSASSASVRIADDAAPTARRGRADKHLVSDETHEEEPVIETHLPDPPRRPRSYRDLDSIPDDFD